MRQKQNNVEKYGDYVLILFGMLWVMTYDLLEIPFNSAITGIILAFILILTIIIAIFSRKKTKEKG